MPLASRKMIAEKGVRTRVASKKRGNFILCETHAAFHASFGTGDLCTRIIITMQDFLP